MKKINYGTDAPKVIRNLIVIGIMFLLIVIFLPGFQIPAIIISIKWTIFFPGISLMVAALLMLLYAKWGKFRQRERILSLHQWKGDEMVLDAGTGLGLLMIGAAKKLTTGKSYGIDIFTTRDLSANSMEQTKLNAEMEKVSDKIIILKRDILENKFEANTFNVILSNLCLHNIPGKQERGKACKEIFRILKPGGKAIISDFKYTSFYRKVFKSCGMNVKKNGTSYFDTFPPLTIITATKENG